MILCIESNQQEILASVLEVLKEELLQSGINARFITFPSDGPFGHQIRVVETGRYKLEAVPEHMLRMVDRMDTFLNPHNGLNPNLEKLDCLILSESQYKEALTCDDLEQSQWIIEINSNIPPIQKMYWLAENDEPLRVPFKMPLLEAIVSSSDTTIAIAHSLAENIMNEVKHG